MAAKIINSLNLGNFLLIFLIKNTFDLQYEEKMHIFAAL